MTEMHSANDSDPNGDKGLQVIAGIGIVLILVMTPLSLLYHFGFLVGGALSGLFFVLFAIFIWTIQASTRRRRARQRNLN